MVLTNKLGSQTLETKGYKAASVESIALGVGIANREEFKDLVSSGKK